MELKSAVIGDAQRDPEGGKTPPRTGFAPDALPEVQPSTPTGNSQTGVSTNYIQPTNEPPSESSSKPSSDHSSKPKPEEEKHWYVLRATYGRVNASYEYLAKKGIEVYHPTIFVYRMVNGKRKRLEESRLPNIFFAQSTEEILKTYVFDNVNLPHLRFYYRHVGLGNERTKEPLIVPDRQMESLKIICGQKEADNVVVPNDKHQFEKGETVIVTDGDFKGVIGKVARFCKQLRVAVIIDGFLTLATAYVPRGYLKPYTPTDNHDIRRYSM